MMDKGLPGKHPLARMGIWGHPWHGLVGVSALGQLTLPNGQLRTYQQPGWPAVPGVTPRSSSRGMTHLVRVPGVAPPVRSEDEQAADAVAGRQWRSEAMLSGGRLQLYGKPLDGWIYIDPEGARWLVRCPQLAEGAAAASVWTVTLTRFGALGAPGETYTHEVASPFPGKTARLEAISPVGNHVVVAIDVAAAPFELAAAWAELSVAGAGAAAAVGAAVLRTEAQTASYSKPEVPSTSYWWVAGTHEEPVFSENGDSGGQEFSESAGGGPYEARRIIAFWYAPDGALKEVALRNHGDCAEANPRGTDRRICTLSASGTIAIEVDGVAVLAVPCALEAVRSWVLDGQITRYPLSGELSVGGRSVLIERDSSNLPGLGLGSLIAAEYRLGFSPPGNGDHSASALPVFHSRQVLGLALRATRSYGLNSTTLDHSPVVSPSGGLTGAWRTEPVSAVFYGSHCPHTGQVVAFSPDPVCWV